MHPKVLVKTFAMCTIGPFNKFLYAIYPLIKGRIIKKWCIMSQTKSKLVQKNVTGTKIM